MIEGAVEEEALQLRQFEPADLHRLQQIRAAAFAPVFDSFRALVGADIGGVAFARSDTEQAALLDSLCGAEPGRPVLVVTRAGEIFGFVAFSVAENGMAEIGLNAVHPDHAGSGIGSWMYQQVLARMRGLGAVAVEVSTGADPAHAPARRAYQKAGFDRAIPSVTYYRLL